MKKVWLTDAAVVTGLGGDLVETWEGLLAGETAIGPIRRFSAEPYKADAAACIEDLARRGSRSLIVELIKRVTSGMGPVPEDAGLFTASTKGGIDNLERLKRGEPAEAGDVPPAAMPAIVSREVGLVDEGGNVSAACASSTIATAAAAARIASGEAGAALVCGMDLVTEFVFSGFSALGALAPDFCKPFDRDRNGLSLGEGAACLLLMDAGRARLEGRRHLATIRGWGAANDARHITAPARNGEGLIRTIRQALKTAGLGPERIDVICAHGTGTVYNDQMELTAFHEIFGDRRIPIFSVKGAVGHTLGAAGGLEAALGSAALLEQTAPPTTGVVHPEKGAENRISARPTPFSGDFLLSTNSGFGGVNAALILEKGGDSWRP
ncbi:MAG: beta-ketoacyl-[acyl-carrier-protein] synthase family protein [Desulfobacterales bacterium]|nr:beta-ketoacyl-[acyl-carrier-protein] synthase family protein [Desulfobacterales bacterium]